MTSNHDAGPGPDASAGMIDWSLAVATARRLAGPGPMVTPAEAQAAVDDLRRFAAEATGPVRDYTGLQATETSAPLIVVDRGGWVQANADAMRDLLDPLVIKLRGRRPLTGTVVDQIGPKLTGVEAGALLAFLSGRVLGQFDPFWNGESKGQPSDAHSAQPAAAGRLLLVAPNIVHVERELRVDPRDFRLWVCLHEETHRVQFTAVPWLRDYLGGQVEAFVDATEVDPQVLIGRLGEGVRALIETLRSGGTDGPSLIDLVQSPEQKAVLDRVTAFMSLLEGHADVVMDGVGPQVVPSVAQIRERFQRRRTSSSGLERTARRLLGVEAKVRQYRDGARFVRGVVARVGMSGFNRVWETPEALPTMQEIGDPAAWVRRVGA